MKKSEARGLFCPDWQQLDDELAIWSIEDDDNYQRLELVLLPCNYVHAEFGPTDDYVRPGCIGDLDQQRGYLGNMKSIVYISEQIFYQNSYGEDSIQSRSRFFTQQTDNFKPSWLNG